MTNIKSDVMVYFAIKQLKRQICILYSKHKKHTKMRHTLMVIILK